MRDTITSMLEEIESRMRDTFEESTANESRLSSACNRAHNCQNDDSETIKKKKNTFSKT
jgi:hypothetical protein